MNEHLRHFVFTRDNWHCRHCNNSHNLDPHHVIYRSAGGEDMACNLITLCRKCHDDIHGGRIKLEIVEVQESDVVVKFWKQKGWRP